MNLVIIGTNNTSRINTEGLNGFKPMIKINDEYPIERIIRIGRTNGIKKVFCITNSHDLEHKQYLSENNFGVPLKLFVQDTENSLHSLFVLAPFLMKEPFFLITMDTVFIENEFSEFVTYSIMQEDTDGVLAVTKYTDDEKPLCVAMNDGDVILKFSDSRDGYSWATGGIYYFLPNVFNEMVYAIQSGISSLSKSLQLLISRGYILKGFSYSQIIKVENASDISKAENLLRASKYSIE
jgi:NDP-sugar pyrophosphorylase family protein